jgi:hypothetical protein
MTETIERMIERIKAERDADAARIAELESALAAATDPQTIDRTTESALAAMRASLARLVEEAAAARAESDALRREVVAARSASAPQRAVRCPCGRAVECPCGLRLMEDAPPPALEPPDHLAGVEVWP